MQAISHSQTGTYTVITKHTINQTSRQGEGLNHKADKSLPTLASKINITPLCLAAAPRSRGPRSGIHPHVCSAERRRRRVLGRELLWSAGDGRQDGQALTDGAFEGC